MKNRIPGKKRWEQQLIPNLEYRAFRTFLVEAREAPDVVGRKLLDCLDHGSFLADREIDLAVSADFSGVFGGESLLNGSHGPDRGGAL